MTIGIPLHKAPDAFFDEGKWARFVTLVGREEAITRLTPSPGIVTFMAQQVVKQAGNLETSLNAERHVEIETLLKELLSWFRADLAAGRLAASGLQPLTQNRVRIPASFWAEARLSFANDAVDGRQASFTEVRIWNPRQLSAEQEALREACVAWLRGRRQTRGDETKKVLKAAAEEKFGSKLTKRVFDAAFAIVYGHRPGRPRKATRE